MLCFKFNFIRVGHCCVLNSKFYVVKLAIAKLAIGKLAVIKLPIMNEAI